ncbi:MAG: mandelate racemase/muconate lactonizing enzyme family protein [Dehalococcoidia bacterium]
MSHELGPIVAVRWQPFRVPFSVPAHTSRTALGEREGYIVTLETADGSVGLGEASPLSDFAGGEFREVAIALEEHALELLHQPADSAWSLPFFESRVTAPSNRVAAAGIETALADLLARRAGQPLWSWLATRAGVQVSTPIEIPANALIDGSTAAEVRDSIQSPGLADFAVLKLKVGAASRAVDIQRVSAARSAAPNAELRIDANGAWDDDTAFEMLCALEPFGVGLCEQPLDPRRPDVLEATARLRRVVPVRVALDESCRTVEQLRLAMSNAAVDAIVIKPMFTGLKAAGEMLRIASSEGLPTIVTTAFDTGIGTAMAVHLAALLPSPRTACGLATISRLEHSLVPGNSLAGHPRMSPPNGPGLGVCLDAEALQRYATGPELQVPVA